MASSDGSHGDAAARDTAPPSPSPSPSPSLPAHTACNLSDRSHDQQLLLLPDGPPSIAIAKLQASSSTTTISTYQLPLINWKEMKILASLAAPLILGNLLNFLLLLVSLTFVGRCGELELSGASIANSFAVVTGFSVVVCVCVF
jgi:MATE family multidrug resistance protein